jgi:hypothetical protein
VTATPPPFAAGVHLPWASVPADVHEWAADIGGGTPLRVQDLAGGFSPGAIARLSFRGHPDVFFKAVGAELNAVSPDMHRREGLVSATLPLSPLLPRLLASYDDGQWVALAFAVIEGRLPHHPWNDAELTLALEALGHLHEVLTPSPSMDVATTGEHLLSNFCGWERLAAMVHPPATLDEWSRRHLEQLAVVAADWPAASTGQTLLHGDLRSDNMLLGADGVVFVDWPHASVGSPVLDLVEWAPSVSLEGGPDPETLLARHAPSRRAEPEAVTALVAAVAGYFTEHSLLPPPPGLPSLRAFQGAQGQVARAWLQRRTGWS